MNSKLGQIFLTVFFMISLSTASALTALAQGSELNTLAEIRVDIEKTIDLLRTIDNNCVVIGQAMLNEALIGVLAARRYITVGKGNLGNILLDAIQAAFNHIERFVENIELFCVPLVDGVIAQVQSQSEAIDEFEGLDERKRNKLLSLLDNIALANLQGMAEILGDIADGFDTAGICPSSLTAAGVRTEQPIAVPALTEQGPLPFELLRAFKICLGSAITVIRGVIRDLNRFVKFKKWVYKALNEAKELLRASNFGGRAAFELTAESAGVTRTLYALNGQRLFIGSAHALNIATLPNGVYFYRDRVQTASGLTQTKMHKLVIRR
jgi:hypothetical protein